MSLMEQYYFGVLVHWYRFKRIPPTIRDLTNLCRPRKSTTSVRSALLSLESKGYVRRDDNGQFLIHKPG